MAMRLALIDSLFFTTFTSTGAGGFSFTETTSGGEVGRTKDDSAAIMISSDFDVIGGCF